MNDPKPPSWYETPAPTHDYSFHAYVDWKQLALGLLVIVAILVWVAAARHTGEKHERADTSGWASVGHGLAWFLRVIFLLLLGTLWLTVALLRPIVWLLTFGFVRLPGVAVKAAIY